MEVKVKYEGQDLTLVVRKPNATEYRLADAEYSKAFTRAVQDGMSLESQAYKLLQKQGYFTEEDMQKMKSLTKKLGEYEFKLKAGGIKKGKAGEFDDKTGYGIAIELIKIRGELLDLQSKLFETGFPTVEKYARNMKENYLMYCCCLKQDGTRFFDSFEHFLENTYKTETNEELFNIALKSFEAYNKLMFGVEDSSLDKLPEYKFLKTNNFIDEKYNLVKDGKRINLDGKFVDEKGRLINENDQLIDSDGRLIDDSGEYLVESKPFLD